MQINMQGQVRTCWIWRKSRRESHKVSRKRSKEKKRKYGKDHFFYAKTWTKLEILSIEVRLELYIARCFCRFEARKGGVVQPISLLCVCVVDMWSEYWKKKRSRNNSSEQMKKTMERMVPITSAGFYVVAMWSDVKERKKETKQGAATIVCFYVVDICGSIFVYR